MKRFLFLVSLGFVLSACSLAARDKKGEIFIPSPTPTIVVYQPVTVDLLQVEKSGQGGVATISQDGDKTRVKIEVTTRYKGVTQPAHVHFGVCPKPGAVKYALTDVVDGKSDTLLEAPMSELVASGSMSINIHKSVDEISVYTSCGDIPL